MAEQIKLGYLREPESKTLFFPYTHVNGIIGLNSFISGILPTKLTDLTNDLTTSTTLALNSVEFSLLKPHGDTSGDISFFAPSTAGTQYSLLQSAGSTDNVGNAPVWFTPSTTGFMKFTSGSGWGTTTLSVSDIFEASSANKNKVFAGPTDESAALPTFRSLVVGDISTNMPNLAAIEGLSGSGYLKKTGSTWSFDPYGGGAKESVMSDGTVVTESSTTTAGLRKQTGASTYTYQKISFAAITNDTSTGDSKVTIVLNGNIPIE